VQPIFLGRQAEGMNLLKLIERVRKKGLPCFAPIFEHFEECLKGDRQPHTAEGGLFREYDPGRPGTSDDKIRRRSD
jgi:hypothetical protein